MNRNVFLPVALAFLLVLSPGAFCAPLKVYILAGQSNMEGQARVYTIDAMRDDEKASELYTEMTDENGNSITVEGVHIVYGDRSGELDATFGSSLRGPKIGPEYTFGIYMKKFVKEPILIIKTAWGGKDLIQQFRPPSAGAFKKEVDKHGNKTGHYYRLMIQNVKEVLADPVRYYPDYDEKAGFEMAGFVWFQGFNDQFGDYPRVDPDDSQSVKDFSEYSRLLACLIRDVRKDLSASEMKFVIGAIGVGGQVATEVSGTPRGPNRTYVALQRAQAAPAAMMEFKDNVAVVYTAKYWDHKLGQVDNKLKKIRRKLWGRSKDQNLNREEKAALHEKLREEILTDEDRRLEKGRSDGAYHYLGSAKIYGQIGKAFAQAMKKLQ